MIKVISHLESRKLLAVPPRRLRCLLYLASFECYILEITFGAATYTMRVEASFILQVLLNVS